MNFHRVLTRVSVFIAYYDLHIQESRDFHFRFSERINFLLRVSIPITSLVCRRFSSGCVFTLSLLYLYCGEGTGAHSSALTWKIPWTEEPGGLQSMRSLRVGHDSVTSLSLFPFMHWRRKWHLTPVFLPGESQGRGSLVGSQLWGRTESDTTEATQQQQQHQAS